MREADASRPAPRGTRAVLLGGLASGVGAYAFTILGARVLGEVEYAPVSVLWTVQYLVVTVGLLSLEAWVTREGSVPAAARRWVGGLTVGLAALATVGGARLLGGWSPVWPVTATMIGLGFGAFAILRGLTAARGAFRAYGVMTGGESLLRLLIAAAVLAAAPSGESLALTLPAGAVATVLAWPLLSRLDRRAGGADQAADPPAEPSRGRVAADGPAVATVPGDAAAPAVGVDGAAATAVAAPASGGTGRYLVQTTTANAMVQLLLAGGPLLTAAIGAAPEVTSRVFVTTTAARAPLVLMYSGLLARLLAAVKDRPASSLQPWTRRGAVGLVAASLAGGGAGWVLGPPLVALAFGAGLRPSPAFAGLTGLAVVLAVGLLAANQVLIAIRAADALVLPWVVGMLVGLGVALVADLPPDLLAGSATVSGLGTAGLLLVPRLLRRTRPA